MVNPERALNEVTAIVQRHGVAQSVLTMFDKTTTTNRFRLDIAPGKIDLPNGLPSFLAACALMRCVKETTAWLDKHIDPDDLNLEFRFNGSDYPWGTAEPRGLAWWPDAADERQKIGDYMMAVNSVNGTKAQADRWSAMAEAFGITLPAAAFMTSTVTPESLKRIQSEMKWPLPLYLSDEQVQDELVAVGRVSAEQDAVWGTY